MTVFRLDGLYCLVLGALLAAGSWDALYETLDLPVPKPAVYAQVAGIVLLVFAYLLWRRDPRPLAGPVAAGNAASAALLVVWLVTGKLEAGALGTTLVALVAAGLAAFALVEARIARA